MRPDEARRRVASRYSATAGEYAKHWGPVLEPMGERLIHALSLSDRAAVLEVGTGTGTLLDAIRKEATEALVVGADLAHGMLCVARSRFPRIPLAVMDAHHLAVRARSFDAVVLAFMLFHCAEPRCALVEAARALRRGGVVGTVTWQKGELPGSEIWEEELDAHGAQDDPLPESVRRHDLVDSPSKVGALFERAGLEVVRVWTERFERRWTWQELETVCSRVGANSRRLRSLPPETRGRCSQRIRERLSRLSLSELVHRPQIVFAIGRMTG